MGQDTVKTRSGPVLQNRTPPDDIGPLSPAITHKSGTEMSKFILVWDTETTGLPLFNEPSLDERQPHIVQLAAILVDLDTRKTISSMDLIVRPDGWTIPDEVAAIHGITTEYALDVGAPEYEVVRLFRWLGEGRVHVAHNSSFDERIMRIALKRYCGESAADEFKAHEFECTMKMATPICAIPPTDKMAKAGFTKYKPPNLREAYRHFNGLDFDGAHNAMADVQACRAIYFAIKDRSGKAEL